MLVGNMGLMPGRKSFQGSDCLASEGLLESGIPYSVVRLVCTGRASPCFEGKLRASNRDQRGAVASGAFGLLSDPVSVAVVRLPSFGLTQPAIEQRRARVRGTLGM